MKKLDLATFMQKPEFAHVSSNIKLCAEIGRISGKAPTKVIIWNWKNTTIAPKNRGWMKALAEIFKVGHGEQFFLS